MKKNNSCKIVVIMIFSTILILIGILTLAYLAKSFILIDIYGSMDTWINATASVCGGALAFGGVWWTIKSQENIRKEDLKIQYRPVVKSNICDLVDEENNLIPQIKCIGNLSYSLNLGIKLFNEGRGELLNGHIENVENTENVDDFNLNEIKKQNNYITIGNYEIIPIHFLVKMGNPMNEIKFCFKYTYFDVFKNKESIYIHLDIFINLFMDSYGGKITYDSYIKTSYNS